MSGLFSSVVKSPTIMNPRLAAPPGQQECLHWQRQLRPIAHYASVFAQHIRGDTRFCCSDQRVGFVLLGSSFLFLLLCIRNMRCMEKSWPYFWRLTFGTDPSEQAQGAATPASYRNIKTRWCNEDDNLKLSQLQNVLLLLLAFSSLSNVAASKPPPN